MKSTSLLSSIHNLQVGQHKHDVLAHQDILYQLIPKKLTHFTLHFAKYQGAVAQALRANDPAVLSRALVDSLIIVLAAANAMSVHLHDRLQSPDITTYKPDTPASRESLLLEYIEIVGNMAKACEVMDHLEDYPSRAVLERSVVELLILVNRFAQSEKLNLVELVMARWQQVEKKFFLQDNQSPESTPQSSLSIVANR